MVEVPEYVPPTFNFIAMDIDDRDNDMFAVPRWVLAVLADELAGHTTCGGVNDEPGCVRCDAIRVAKQASEHGLPE